MGEVIELRARQTNDTVQSVEKTDSSKRIWVVGLMELLDRTCKVVLMRVKENESFCLTPYGLYNHLWLMLGPMTGEEVLHSLKNERYEVVSLQEAVDKQERWARQRAITEVVYVFYKDYNGCHFLVEDKGQFAYQLHMKGWKAVGYCFDEQVERAALDPKTKTYIVEPEEALGLVQPS